MEEGQANSRLQYQGRIQALEKELAHYKWANHELTQKLSVSDLEGQGKGEDNLGSGGLVFLSLPLTTVQM